MTDIKKIAYAAMGIAWTSLPAAGVYFSLINEKHSNPVAAYIAMALIMILVTAFAMFLGAIINKIFEDSGKTIFLAFFLSPIFKKRKRICHSELGYFELAIDEDKLEGQLIRQRLLYCETFCKFRIDNPNLMESIKKHLDMEYSHIIEKREESRKKKEFVEQLMKKDGYLDPQTRRDKKIGDLGI